jgi:hypothetical protein
LRAAEAILDREDQRLRPDDRLRRARGRFDVTRLRGDDDQIARTRVRRRRRRIHPYGAVARGAFDAQAVRPNRIDVLAPAVDCPDFVSRAGEQPGVHRAHRAATDDRDLHRGFTARA